jgi:putrescine importer
VFGSVNQRWKTPHGNIFLIVMIELILGTYVGQDFLAELINFGAISAFIMLNVGVIWLGFNLLKGKIILQSLEKNISNHKNIVVKFFIFPTITLVIMLAIFLNMKSATLLYGALWSCIGVSYYWCRKRIFD